MGTQERWISEMAKKRVYLILCLLGTIVSCNGSEDEQRQPAPTLEERVEALLSEMTLDEKLEQMVGSTPLAELLQVLVEHKPWATADNERLGIPGLRFVDGPRGVTTCFPVAMARGAAWDVDLEERIGRAVGREARAKGANILNAPCVNLLRHPGWGRAQETYGEDPFHLGTMGVHFIDGVQKHVMADVKHYSLNSIEVNRFTIDIDVDERTLREVYLPHFRMCVQEARTAAVMCAYNQVNGRYCCENEHLLKQILREDWGFDGFVVTDWVFAARSTVPSLRAGLDVEMPTPIYYGSRLESELAAGTVTEEEIDEVIRRILRQKIRFGLLGKLAPPEVMVDDQAHASLALEAARKGIVLLKNENEVLPFKGESVKSVAVIGRFANTARLGDLGSSNVVPAYAITPYQGIADRAGTAVSVSFNDGSNLTAARELASHADAVLVVAALTEQDEGEWIFFVGGDRESLVLSQSDESLINEMAAVTDRCIVVLEAGSAISMDAWIENVEAVLMAWYPGQEGGNAIADVLFGHTNPGGKLPITFPKSAGQLYPFGTRQPSSSYGYDHGYYYFDREGLEPLFPFGFGLSYTEYTYNNLRVDPPSTTPMGRVTISLDVTNIGEMAGEETVQVYIGYQGSAVDRHVKELKAFGKVGLNPGEKKSLSLVVEASDLAYYNPDASQWEVEDMPYTVYVGASSQDIRLTGSFRIESLP
jgi:beta-glucosidase